MTDMSTRVGTLSAGPPGHDRVGHRRPRRRAGPTRRPGRLGAVVVKSLAAEPWPGNPPPRVHETPAGMLNSVGLQGPGRGRLAGRRAAAAARHRGPGGGQHLGPHGRRVSPGPPPLLADAPDQVVAVEVNLSCPNLDHGHHRVEMFAQRGRRRGPRSSPPAGRRPALVGQAHPGGDRPGRGGRGGGRRRRRGRHADQHRAGPGHRPRDPPAPPGRRRRRPVGTGHPPGGRAGGPRCPPRPARAVHHRGGWRGPAGRRRRAPAGRGLGRAGGHRHLRRPAGRGAHRRRTRAVVSEPWDRCCR